MVQVVDVATARYHFNSRPVGLKKPMGAYPRSHLFFFYFFLETLVSHALKPSCHCHRYWLYHVYVALYNDAARCATLIVA